MIVLLSVEEAPDANRCEESDLDKARAQIRVLQADNIRLRGEIAKSERELRAVRMAYDDLLAVSLGIK